MIFPNKSEYSKPLLGIIRCNISKNIEIKNTEGNVSKYPVFGGKYKMRLSSKQTGRKIDINFTVKEPENIINEI